MVRYRMARFRSPAALAALALLLPAAALAAPAAKTVDEVVGTWKGTSLCTDREKHPACNDEVVVYHFAPAPGTEGAATLTANKIVDGEEQTMGVLEVRFDDAKQAWTAEYTNPRTLILWSYRIHGDELTGTLHDIPSGELLRRVAATRQR